MNDDWRLQVDLQDEADGRALAARLAAEQLDHELSDAYHDRVVVSRDAARLFLYTGTRKQAEAVRAALEADAQRHGWEATVEFRRWHPLAEEWEDADKPLPDNEAARLAEREALMTREREDTARRGYPEFEVRADLPSHHDAAKLAERLQAEGLPAVRRWKYLLVGATDEDAAKALADRLRDEAPPDSKIKVEGTWAVALGERSPSRFAVLGGLGG